MLQFLGHRVSLCDIRSLAALIASAKQQNYDLTELYEIDAISRPVRNPKFAHPMAHRLHISSITEGESLNAHRNGSFSTTIPQPAQPLGKYIGLADFEHLRMYPTSYSLSKLPLPVHPTTRTNCFVFYSLLR